MLIVHFSVIEALLSLCLANSPHRKTWM